MVPHGLTLPRCIQCSIAPNEAISPRVSLLGKNQSSPIAVPRQPRSLRSKDIPSGNPYTPFLGKLDLPWRIYAFGLGSCYLVNFNFTLLPKRLPQHGRVELAGGHHHPGNFCESHSPLHGM